MNRLDPASPPIPSEELRAHVDAILASRTFATAARSRDLLAYLRDRYVEGLEAPKEFEVATAVFQRPAGFDAGTDSIVRVTANRLRGKLREYYATEAPAGRFEVRLSRGAYALELAASNGTAAPTNGSPVGIVEATQDSLDPEDFSGAPVRAPVERPQPKPLWASRNTWYVAGIFVVLGVAGLLFGYFRLKLRPVSSFRIQRVTENSVLVGPAKFSPDGDSILVSLQRQRKAPSEVYKIDLRDAAAEPKRIGYPSLKIYGASKSGLLLIEELLDGRNLYRARSAGAPAEFLDRGIELAKWDSSGEKLLVVRTIGSDSALEYPEGNVLLQSHMRHGSPFQFANISPNRRWINYGRPSGRGTDYDLWLLDRNTRSTRVILTGFVEIGPSVWSPFRDELLVSGIRRGEEPRIYAVRPNGEARVLWETPNRLVLDDILPDGRILVREIVSRLETFGQLNRGDGLRELEIGKQGDLEAISPDGRVLIFSEHVPNNPDSDLIYLVNASSPGEPVRLTHGLHPRISYDGRRLLIIKPKQNRRRIAIFDLQTREEKDVSAGGYQYSLPVWNTDSRSFYFMYQASNATYPSCYRQNLETGEVQMVQPGTHGVVPLENPKEFAYNRSDDLVIRNYQTGEERVVGNQSLKNLHISAPIPGSKDLVASSRPFGENSRMTVFRLDTFTGQVKEIRELDAGFRGKFRNGISLMSTDTHTYAFTVAREFRTLYVLHGYE